MPAMHDDVLNAMVKRLEHKRDIMLRTLEFDMSHDECMRLIAPSDHIDILTKAAVFADINVLQHWLDVAVPATIDGDVNPRVHLMMRTHSETTPPLVPRHPQWQPGQSGTKVIDWLIRRYAIGRRFGLARHVLYTLNRECESGTQIRYMWPVVMHLCQGGDHPKMERWVEKFSAYRPCRHVPAVSPALKAAIQDSSALLTTMAMIGEDVPEPPERFVMIAPYLMGTFPYDGTDIQRM